MLHAPDWRGHLMLLFVVGCGGTRSHDTVDVDLAASSFEAPRARASAPSVSAFDPTPTSTVRADLGPGPSPTADEGPGESICDIDPGLCALQDPKLVASCGCDHLVDRARTTCLIDCATRERLGIDAKLRSGRY